MNETTTKRKRVTCSMGKKSMVAPGDKILAWVVNENALKSNPA